MDNQNKVTFRDSRKTVEVELPSFAGSKVVIYSTLLIGDLDGIDITSKDTLGLESLPKLIKSWNFVDESGKDLPITKDIIKKLPATDVNVLVQKMIELNTTEKKN